MAHTTANSAHLIRSEIYSAQLKEELLDETMAMKYVRWLSEFPDGDTFTIPSVGQAAGPDDYTEDTAVRYHALDTGEFQFSMTAYLSSGHYITKKARQDAFYSAQLEAGFVPKEARAIMVRLEGDIFALQTKEAPGVFCENPGAYSEQMAAPAGEEAILWSIGVNRAHEAAARILWPFGDTRLSRRLHRVTAPTLLLWGEADKVVPPSYATRFADGMSGKVSTMTIARGGHLVELDRPQETAAAILAFAQ